MKIDWSRFENYGLWVSIFALIPLVLNVFGVTVVPEQYSELTNAILSVLVAAGILSNPTTEAKWFLDDNKETEETEETKATEEK